jgi:CBS domain-containing protein
MRLLLVEDDARLADLLARSLREQGSGGRERRGQYLYPIVDGDGGVHGVVTRGDLHRALPEGVQGADAGLSAPAITELIKANPVVAYPDEPLRVIVNRMAETGLTQFPVIDRTEQRRLLGLVSLRDLLHARERNWAEERERERTIRIRLFSPREVEQPESVEAR